MSGRTYYQPNCKGSPSNQWFNICEQHEFTLIGSSAPRAPCFVEVEKTRFGKRIRNMITIAAISAIVFLPSAVYLATLSIAANPSPNYCNNAGGCPWTT